MSDPVLQGIKNTLTLQAMAEFWASSDDVGEGVAGMRIARESENGILAVYRSTDDYNFDDGTGSAALLIDVDGNVTLTDASLELTGIGHIALGSPPPTSASAGTGIWIDDTGIFGLASNVQQAYMRASDGKIVAGAGNVVLDTTGITITNDTAAPNAQLILTSDDAGASDSYISYWMNGADGQINIAAVDGLGNSALTISARGAMVYGGSLSLNGALTWATNATYDIGASGATSARDLYLSRKVYFLATRGIASGLYDRVNSDTTVGNTTTETNIYSKSITANDMGSTGGLRLRLIGQYTNNTGATRTLTVKPKFGSTTLATHTLSLTTSGTNGQYEMVVHVFNTATNAQRGTSNINAMRGGGLIDSAFGVALTATEDTTSAKTLSVTVQWDSASASATLTNKLATLEVLP